MLLLSYFSFGILSDNWDNQTDFLPFQLQLEDTEHENEKEQIGTEDNISHFEVAGVCLLANAAAARSDVSSNKGKILALEALLPLDSWSNSWIT